MTDTTNEKLGIDKVKLVLMAIFALGANIEEDLMDGEMSFGEALGTTTETLPDLVKIFTNRKEIGAQIVDIDDVEREELVVWAKEQFDLADDVLEAKIEAGIDAINAILKLTSL